jgi:hypothetical protein
VFILKEIVSVAGDWSLVTGLLTAATPANLPASLQLSLNCSSNDVNS